MEKTDYTLKKFDSKVRDKFKAACALQGVTMRNALLWFMRKLGDGEIKIK